ncbi:hypothetical protein [Streptomyces sp. NPDC057557]|uniref:hypothetical protein n=1 Tax=Streptomyces sp. NPDC057557 TaxID=3346167 RepID=UPI0036816442
MTEHIARCLHDSNDTIRTYIVGDHVFLRAHIGGDHGTVALEAVDARVFARGILALADKIDGGAAEETPAEKPIKVGDCIRVITTGSAGALVKAGETFTVRKVTDWDVQVDGDGAHDRWYLNHEDVEKVVDEATATLADSRPKVGDRLRVTEDNPRCCPVVTGDVITVVETDYDHDGEDCVRFLHGDDSYRWIIPLTAVEKAPTLADANTSPESYRASLLEQARKYVDPTATAAELLAVARFIAGESA